MLTDNASICKMCQICQLMFWMNVTMQLQNSIIHSLIECTNINIISWILVENIWSVNTGYSQPKTIRLWLVYISETSNTENKV